MKRPDDEPGPSYEERLDQALDRCRKGDASELDRLLDPDAGPGEVTVGRLLGFLCESDRSLVEAPAALPRIPGFEVSRCIGSGGMGVVYLARQQEPPRDVALKVLRARSGSSGERARRFQREAAALARFQCPEVAALYAVGTTDEGLQWLALERVEGRPLDVAARVLGMRLPDRLRLLARVARAVHGAHLRHVVHRDLKPSNILVDANGQPKILDFGLARLLEADGDADPAAGTVPFASPEQLGGEPSDVLAESDVYALGAIAYLLATDRLPHDAPGASAAERRRAVREDPPVPPRKLVPTLPRDVEAIILRALEKDPRRRYRSAEEFALDLERFLEHRPVAARPAGPLGQIARLARRRPQAVVLCAVALAAGAAWLGREIATFQRTARSNVALRSMLSEGRYAVGSLDGCIGEIDADIDEYLETVVDDQSLSEQSRAAIARSMARAQFGTRLLRLGAWSLARPQLEEALELRQHHLESPNRLIFESLHDLAVLEHADKRFAAADRYYQRAIEEALALGPAARARWKHVRGDRARLLLAEGQPVQAEALLRENVDRSANDGSAGSAEHVRAIDDLALHLQSTDRSRETLALCDEAEAMVGSRPEVADLRLQVLTRRAIALREAGELEAARADLVRALGAADGSGGRVSGTARAGVLDILASVELALHRYASASACSAEACALLDRALLPDHELLTLARSVHLNHLQHQGLDAEVERILRARSTIDDRRDFGVLERLGARIDLAQWTGDHGRQAEADQLWRGAVAGTQALLRPGHRLRVSALAGQANRERLLGDPDEALRLFEEAVRDAECAVPPWPGGAAGFRALIADCHLRQGRLDTAVAEIGRARAAAVAGDASAAGSLAEVAWIDARIAAAHGDFEWAAAGLEQALALMRNDGPLGRGVAMVSVELACLRAGAWSVE